jgi:hypothetical protein
MSGWTENRARGAKEAAGQRETVFNLATSRKMIPLIRLIIDDMLDSQAEMAKSAPELTVLDRQRHQLAWPERSRRYDLQEQVAIFEKHIQDARAELGSLGVALVDRLLGRVGFPTIVNGRRAYFSWQPGEEGILFWHFPNELERKPVPSAWSRNANLSFSSKF